MRTIKLWDGIRVTTTGASEIFETPGELWDALHIEDDAAKTEITKQLYCFGKVDLSAAYGETVILTVYINKEENHEQGLDERGTASRERDHERRWGDGL